MKAREDEVEWDLSSSAWPEYEVTCMMGWQQKNRCACHGIELAADLPLFAHFPQPSSSNRRQASLSKPSITSCFTSHFTTPPAFFYSNFIPHRTATKASACRAILNKQQPEFLYRSSQYQMGFLKPCKTHLTWLLYKILRYRTTFDRHLKKHHKNIFKNPKSTVKGSD